VLGDSLEMRDKRTVQPTTVSFAGSESYQRAGAIEPLATEASVSDSTKDLSRSVRQIGPKNPSFRSHVGARPTTNSRRFDLKRLLNGGHRHTPSIGMTAHVIFRHEAVDLEGPLNLHDRRITGQQMLTLSPECLQAAFLRSLDPDQRDRQGPSTARA